MADLKKLRILVIDDELTQRMLVKEYLEEAGHQVTLSEDGKRGLKVANSTKPDIILLDFLLPSVDGNSVCKSLKSNPATAEIPIILVTASRESDVIDKGLAAGADDFVTKPVDWAYLADRVVNVVKRSNEKLELTRLLKARSDAEPPQQPAPIPAIDSDTRLEELMRSAEIQIEQALEAGRAELARMEAEHATAVKYAIEQTRSDVEAEMAARQNSASRERQREIERVRSECASEIAAIKAQHSKELIRAREQAGQEWSAKLAIVEAQTAEAIHRAEESVRADWTTYVAELQGQHDRDVHSLIDRAEIEIETVRASAQHDMLVAERRHCAELGELRNTLEQPSIGASASALAAREAAIREAEASLQAAWTLSFRTAAAQSALAAAITAKSQAALQHFNSTEISEVERSARALSSLTTNFRLLAHSMVSGVESNEAPVHLGSLIGSIAEQAGRISAERRVAVRTTQVDTSITILVDESRLRYALMCLLINAIRFTPAGGAVDLVVGASRDGCVRVGVSDNGLGIAPAKLQELRTCLDSSAQGAGAGGSDGTGLGIPVALAFARKMSGALELESRLGDGTQANLVFPASKRCHGAERASVG